MTKDEALKLALEALFAYEEDYPDDGEGGTTYQIVYDQNKVVDAITAIKQALNDATHLAAPYVASQLVQEPAFHGFMDKENCCVHICYTPWAPRMTDGKLPTAYYTTPPAAQRQWQRLTDEEKQEWIDAMPYTIEPRHCMILVNVMEAKLKEKNT